MDLDQNGIRDSRAIYPRVPLHYARQRKHWNSDPGRIELSLVISHDRAEGPVHRSGRIALAFDSGIDPLLCYPVKES